MLCFALVFEVGLQFGFSCVSGTFKGRSTLYYYWFLCAVNMLLITIT